MLTTWTGRLTAVVVLMAANRAFHGAWVVAIALFAGALVLWNVKRRLTAKPDAAEQGGA